MDLRVSCAFSDTFPPTPLPPSELIGSGGRVRWGLRCTCPALGGEVVLLRADRVSEQREEGRRAFHLSKNLWSRVAPAISINKTVMALQMWLSEPRGPPKEEWCLRYGCCYSLWTGAWQTVGGWPQRAVLVAQSCLTHCDLMDCSPPGSSVHGILQARRLNCVAIPFSRGPSQPKDWTQISCTAGSFFTVWATREAQIAEMRVKQPSSMSPDTCHTQKSTKFLNLRYPGFPSLTIISDVQIICLLCCKPSASCSAVSDSLWHHGLYSPSGSSVHGIFQARMLECCQALLQEIFPTQGSNLGLQHCRQILSEPPGKPLRHTLPYNLTSSPASPEKFSQDYLRRCLPGLKS